VGKENPDRIIELGKTLFGTNTVEECAAGFESFFKKLGSPVKASEDGIEKDQSRNIMKLMNTNKVSGMHVQLKSADLEEIVEMIF
jgi:alcohol dehydrogenase YqhD (iron-dependent ADH family)